MLLHTGVALTKRLPFRKKGAHGGRCLWRKQAEVSPMKQGVPQASLRASEAAKRLEPEDTERSEVRRGGTPRKR